MSVGAQADNAGGENKNQWMMRYLSLLVDRGCFRSACLATLQVGHTHEDIDAIFGIMSTEIAKTLDWDSPMAMAECLGRRTRASVGHGNELHTQMHYHVALQWNLVSPAFSGAGSCSGESRTTCTRFPSHLVCSTTSVIGKRGIQRVHKNITGNRRVSNSSNGSRAVVWQQISDSGR